MRIQHGLSAGSAWTWKQVLSGSYPAGLRAVVGAARVGGTTGLVRRVRRVDALHVKRGCRRGRQAQPCHRPVTLPDSVDPCAVRVEND
jgi:hypothetical protein